MCIPALICHAKFIQISFKIAKIIYSKNKLIKEAKHIVLFLKSSGASLSRLIKNKKKSKNKQTNKKSGLKDAFGKCIWKCILEKAHP